MPCFIFRLTLGKILQRLFSQRGELNEEYQLPKCIGDRINKYRIFEQQKVHNENEAFKIPQNTDVLSDNLPDENGYVRIKNISVVPPFEDNFMRNNKIGLNKGGNLNEKNDLFPNNINNENNINDITNSNMNINTNANLFANQEYDDMDVFPNYPRPSLGTNDNLK